MDDLECFRSYLAVKCHFNGRYDYFRHEGKIKATRLQLYKRTDAGFFRYIATKYDGRQVLGIFVSNTMHHIDFWAGEVLDKESEKIYQNWRGRLTSMEYNLLDAISKVCERQQELDPKRALVSSIAVKEGSYPTLLRMALHQDISPEVLIFLDLCLNFFPDWDREIKDSLVWPKVRTRCLKYKPFLLRFLSKNKTQHLAKLLVAKLSV